MRKFIALAALVAAQSATAQEQPNGWAIGGFATIGQSIYVGEDVGVSAIPTISYKSDEWTFGLNGVTYEVFESETSELAVFLSPRFSEIIFSDAVELQGLDRNVTADVGASWSYALTPKTSFGMSAAQEITGEHNGQEIELSLEQEIALGRIPLWVSGTLTWQSEGLASYLYGVGPSEVTGTRSAYDPGAVLIPSISVSTGYPLSKTALLFGALTYSVLPDAVTQSPIVDRDDALSLITGVAYTF